MSNIRDYNYHNWSAYMVRKPEDKPKGEHYAAVLFGTRNEYTPAYDVHDNGGTTTVPDLSYFAFSKKEDLEMWVGEASKANKQFMFFHVAKLGEVKLSVSTDI